MTPINVEIIGMDAVLRRFEGMAAALSNTAPLRAIVGERLVESTRRRFVTSTAPDGSAWAPLALSTTQQTIARYGKSLRRSKNGKPMAGVTADALNAKGRQRLAGRKPLVDTGALAASTFWQNEGQNLVIATNNSVAAFHQFGTRAHTIRARNKPNLWIPAYQIKTKQVNHPGIKARPFFGLSNEDGAMMLRETGAYILGYTR